MSGTTTDLGSQPVVATVDLPSTKIPALNTAGTAVIVEGQTLIDAAAVGAVPVIQNGTITATGPGTAPDLSFDVTNPAKPVFGGTVPQGATGATPQISATATALATGVAPTVTVSGTAEEPALDFGLPAAPSPVLRAGSGTTLTPGSAVTVTIDNTDPLNPVISIGSPQGATGGTGAPGVPGPAIITSQTFPFQGFYDATAGAGSPALPTAASGNSGYLWIVTVAGSALTGITLPTGVTSASIGDVVISNGSIYSLVKGVLTAPAVAALIVAGVLSLPAAQYATTDVANIIHGITTTGGLPIDVTYSDGSSYRSGLKTTLVNGLLTVMGPDGTVIFTAGNGSGNIALPVSLTGLATGLTTASSAPTSAPSLVIADAIGFTSGWSLDANGNPPATSSGSSSGDFSLAEVTAFDAMTQALGASLNTSRKMQTQPVMSAGANVIDNDGQSFDTNLGGTPLFPVDQTQPRASVSTVGSALNFTINTTGTVTPQGSAAFYALIARGSTGYQQGAINAFRDYDLAAQGQPASYTGRALVGNITGTAGMTIEELSYSAAPVSPATVNLFQGTKMGVHQAQHDVAVAASLTPTFVAVLFDQGQSNYSGTAGGARDAATFAAETEQYIVDTNTYITTGIYSQALPPLWVVAQTGGPWTIDNVGNHIGIGQGQINYATARPDCVLGMPSFNLPYHTDVTINHPTTNGYRWRGCKYAQILREVLLLGKNWDYMRPLYIWWRDKTVLIGVHPRKGPLQFFLPYVGYSRVAAGTYPNQGFDVSDALGAVTIESVALEGVGTIVLTLARTPTAAPVVSAGGAAAAGGNTFVQDSDDWVAPLLYEGTVTGQNAAENDPTMNGLPYPMNNQMFAFSMTATPV